MIRPSSATLARAAVFGCAALLTGMASPGVASAADQVHRTADLAYTCDYPLIGQGPLTVRMRAVGPAAVPGGGSTTARDVEADLDVPEDVAQQLYHVGGVDGVRGTFDVELRITGGIPDAASIRDLVVPEQFYHGQGDFPVRAVQDNRTAVPTVTAGPPPGPLTTALDDSVMTLDLHFVNSSPDWQRQEPFRCTPDPDQDTTWISTPVT